MDTIKSFPIALNGVHLPNYGNEFGFDFRPIPQLNLCPSSLRHSLENKRLQLVFLRCMRGRGAVTGGEVNTRGRDVGLGWLMLTLQLMQFLCAKTWVHDRDLNTD